MSEDSFPKLIKRRVSQIRLRVSTSLHDDSYFDNLFHAKSPYVESVMLKCGTFEGHDNVIKWKHFPHYWPFVQELSGQRGIPLTKASDAELLYFFYLRLNKRLSKHSWRRWFETTLRSLWRHFNAYASWYLMKYCLLLMLVMRFSNV